MKTQLTTNAASKMDPWKDPLIRNRILFIGGLHIQTTEDELYQFLLRFGEVMWFKIQKDQVTGAPKGFAFALFYHQEAYDKILEVPQYQIRGFDVEVRTWKDQTSYITEKELIMQRKVFVKDLLERTNEQELASYFSRFGRVVKAEVLRNHQDRTSRRIAFIIFSSEEEARKCLLTRVHLLPGGHQITCLKCKTKKAVHENFSTSNQQSNIKKFECSNNPPFCFDLSENGTGRQVNALFTQPLLPYSEQVITLEPAAGSTASDRSTAMLNSITGNQEKKSKRPLNPSSHFTTEDLDSRNTFKTILEEMSGLDKVAEADTTLPGVCDMTLDLAKKTKEVYIHFYAFPDLF